MLTQIRPESTALERAGYVPQPLLPLVAAVEGREPLEPVVLSITRKLGFDSFMYGASVSANPTQESKSYVFTTLPSEWVSLYDQRAYIEVDPRVRHGVTSSTPLIWDWATEAGKDPLIDEFLAEAEAHGVASGVAIALHGLSVKLALIALNSAERYLRPRRRNEIADQLGDILLLSIYFHEIFMKNMVGKGIAPRSQGYPLSERERQCLILAARGHTSHDIAQRLSVAERTVQFHFDGIRSKLNAANRQEAIAKAIAAGIIQP